MLLPLLTFLGGCQSMWVDVPQQEHEPKFRLDAPWYSENPSDDLISRLTKERQEYVGAILDQRDKGNVSVPLAQAIHGKQKPSEPSQIASNTSLVLTKSNPSITADSETSIESKPIQLEFSENNLVNPTERR
ncbi:MAG: hypothetical protein P8L85_12800 [Rubripirellula sp.]|nr:hypothetical protein [Rubripirellula sp.]